ncbi:hypothetical protein JG688_00008124 [Phytophthora aleatoria]|uniref:Uncharacterized protein n=1 Tax=Phytophthora aleatoria TaxID=2496075 RepID=A0A8J5INR5_9STRA|nr:hypothetical protein JG688_00008124 [Phytophthora aleatoria]
MFCALHIYFNVCSHFRQVEPNIDNIRRLVFRLQATTTLNEYEIVLSEIHKQYPSPRSLRGEGNPNPQTVVQYLHTLHPTSWTKFGNGLLTPEESMSISGEWKNISWYGNRCSLFAGRITSTVEGTNNDFLLSGIRDSQVLGAFILLCNAAVENLAAKRKLHTTGCKRRTQ